jgi:predicted SAM-dependent methyltransferase
VNIDIRSHCDGVTFPYDIRRGLPFQNGQVARIFAEHIVEHLEFREEMPRLIRECYRVLEVGGRLRIVVPDGERWLHAYVSGDTRAWSDLGFGELPPDMPTRMAMINHVFHQGGEHHFAYDYATLEWALKQGGFTQASKASYGVSADETLCLDRAAHAKYSLYVEAQK